MLIVIILIRKHVNIWDFYDQNNKREALFSQRPEGKRRMKSGPASKIFRYFSTKNMRDCLSPDHLPCQKIFLYRFLFRMVQ